MAPLYFRVLGINDPVTEIFVPLVHMLHLSDLTTEDVKLGDNFDVGGFV